MSKFSHYAVKADAVARDTLGQIKAAADALEAAEQRKRETRIPNSSRADAERLAQAARAEADLQAARLAYDKARRELPYTARNRMAAIRKELSAALNGEYSADPTKLDTRTVELLKSGILRSGEYVRLMNDARSAGNTVMSRVIGRYAATATEEAAEKYGFADQRAMELRAIAVDSDNDVDMVSGKLEAFDVITEAFETTVNNTAMIDSWEQLTSPIIENF